MALELDPRTLWADVARTRYFLIPDGAELPSGGCVIWTPTGRRMDVDDAVLARFEIAESDAKAWASAELGRVLDGARAAAEEVIGRIRSATEALRRTT